MPPLRFLLLAIYYAKNNASILCLFLVLGLPCGIESTTTTAHVRQPHVGTYMYLLPTSVPVGIAIDHAEVNHKLTINTIRQE